MITTLSIVIVNYNGKKFLKECFESIQQAFKKTSYEIIVVDNNSADGSSDWIKNNYPDIVLIQSKENLGFGKGNNLGVSHAKGKYILLLNNDTILLDPLDDLIDQLENNPKIGAIGIKMLDKNKNYLPSAGHFPNLLNILIFKKLFNTQKDFVTGNFNQKSYEVDWVTGSFVLLKKDTYHLIKGFDEDYFMYVEDIDFCKKINLIGLRNIFLPSYSYIHFVGFNKSRNLQIIDSLKLYIHKHIKNPILRLFYLFNLEISQTIKKIK